MTNISISNSSAPECGDLLIERAYVAGKWVSAQLMDEVINPANQELVGRVPRLGAKETNEAIAAAATAQADWAMVAPIDRATVLRRWHDLVLENRERLAEILTLEQGKPIVESLAEVTYGASYLEWFAEQARRIEGSIVAHSSSSKRILTLKQPIGVTAAITPWNFPIATVTRKVAPALAAGCAQVLKPSPETPFSALALARLAENAGVPPGLFSVVTGDAAEIGSAMTSSNLVRLITFTGSTPVGKLLMRQASDTVKKVDLELGGHAPFIVFDDADIDRAVSELMACKFRNMGQACVAANKVFVHESIYEKFSDAVVAAVSELKVGPGIDSDTDQGPLINQAAIGKVGEHVDDAVSKGAKLLIGGRGHELGGLYYAPTVLTNISLEMLIANEETFGPVVPLFQFSSEEDLVNLVNSTEVGLASYFFSQNIDRIWRMVEALEYGMVGVNTGVLSAAEAPFGGIKQSGLGREGSSAGLEEYLETKYVCLSLAS